MFPDDKVVELCLGGSNGPWRESNGSLVDSDTALIRRDLIGEKVGNYGELSTKIESLAQLRDIPGARSELALVSLARGYVDRCMTRSRRWTSGIHLFHWTASRLAEEPELDALRDLWIQTSLTLDRQLELAKWSLVMLRVTFLSDMAAHSSRDAHPISQLADLHDRAALAARTVKLRALIRWLKGEGTRAVAEALPPEEYRRLARELHVDR